jgi:hypothetical protein
LSRDEDGQIISGWLVRLVVVVAIVGTILIEGGAVVFNRLQAKDIADQASAEAGISYFAYGQSVDAARTRAREYVEGEQHARFVDVRVDQASSTIFVTVEKTANTRIVQRIGSLKKYTVAHTTGNAPLRR